MLCAAHISMTDDASSIGSDEENLTRKNTRNSLVDERDDRTRFVHIALFTT